MVTRLSNFEKEFAPISFRSGAVETYCNAKISPISALGPINANSNVHSCLKSYKIEQLAKKVPLGHCCQK